MKRNVVLVGISLMLLFLLGIGVSYSMWNMTNTQEKNNIIVSSECFDVSITSQENSINLQNTYPISNEKGKSLTPFTFTVTNICETAVKYSINLESLKGSTLSNEFLDVMLNNGEVKRLNSYNSVNKVNSSSVESRELETGILDNKESRNYSLRLWIDYDTTMEDLNNETKVLKSKVIVIGTPINYTGQTVFNFDYTGGEQTFIAPVSGTYKVETWGASGDDIQCENGSDYLTICTGSNMLPNSYGLGAYTAGNISIAKDNKLFIYVGSKSGYNGGGGGEARGGGATDIRLEKDNLYSRIIVAAGGGGGLHTKNITLLQVGSAGGLIGYSANSITSSGLSGYSGYGATQVSGGKTGKNGWDRYEYNEKMNGSFGQSGYANPSSGGGGGWYGGGHGRHTGNSWPGGGGGSSYISGHPGCLAVSSNSSTALKNNCTESSNSLECSISYTGYYFINTLMIDGDGYKWTTKKENYTEMPSHNDNSTTMVGNTGNGYARITLVSINN